MYTKENTIKTLCHVSYESIFLAKHKSSLNISILTQSIMTFVKHVKIWPPAFSQIAQGTQIANESCTEKQEETGDQISAKHLHIKREAGEHRERFSAEDNDRKETSREKKPLMVT